jgi:hypothetical protein
MSLPSDNSNFTKSRRRPWTFFRNTACRRNEVTLPSHFPASPFLSLSVPSQRPFQGHPAESRFLAAIERHPASNRPQRRHLQREPRHRHSSRILSLHRLGTESVPHNASALHKALRSLVDTEINTARHNLPLAAKIADHYRTKTIATPLKAVGLQPDRQSVQF